MDQTKEAFLSLTELSLSTYKGVVFEQVSLQAGSSELVAFCGHRATGKSALLLSIAGHMHTSSGRLRVNGIDGSSASGRKRIQAMSGKSVFEGINDLPDSLSVISVLKAEVQDINSLARFADKLEQEEQEGNANSTKAQGAIKKLSSGEREAIYRRYLRVWDLEKLAHEQIKNLSGKQQVRLGIALACVDNAKLVLVNDIEDELTLNQSLDLMALLKRVAHSCNICICVGMVERALAQEADKVVYLAKEGK